jgi:hypothetical protein
MDGVSNRSTVAVIKHRTVTDKETVTARIEVCACNRCCSGKALSITNSECVYVASGMQHAMRKSHIVMCGLPSSTVFFHGISLTTRFS